MIEVVEDFASNLLKAVRPPLVSDSASIILVKHVDQLVSERMPKGVVVLGQPEAGGKRNESITMTVYT
jgi:hypothetical protein